MWEPPTLLNRQSPQRNKNSRYLYIIPDKVAACAPSQALPNQRSQLKVQCSLVSLPGPAPSWPEYKDAGFRPTTISQLQICLVQVNTKSTSSSTRDRQHRTRQPQLCSKQEDSCAASLLCQQPARKAPAGRTTPTDLLLLQLHLAHKCRVIRKTSQAAERKNGKYAG
jgi:hypothetical protein